MADRVEMERRRGEVLDVIQGAGWGRSTERRLAKKWGVNTRSVRRIKAEALAELVADRPSTEERRQELIEGIEGVIVQARAAGKYNSALMGYGILAKIEGLERTTITLQTPKSAADRAANLESLARRTGLIGGEE